MQDVLSQAMPLRIHIWRVPEVKVPLSEREAGAKCLLQKLHLSRNYIIKYGLQPATDHHGPLPSRLRGVLQAVHKPPNHLAIDLDLR